jgi:hypothetical protein
VVDTVGLSTKTSYIDNFRTPRSEGLHVMERFTVEPVNDSTLVFAAVDANQRIYWSLTAP